MSAELLNFKKEKRDNYVQNAVTGAAWLVLDPLPAETAAIREILEDCFNAAFDFALDAKEQFPTEETQAQWDLDERRAQIRSTALDMIKSHKLRRLIFRYSISEAIIEAAIQFEELLKQKVL